MPQVLCIESVDVGIVSKVCVSLTRTYSHPRLPAAAWGQRTELRPARRHAALCITRTPGNQLWLSNCFCTRRKSKGATHSAHDTSDAHFRLSREIIATDDSWTEIHDGDVLHVCPTRAESHEGKFIYRDYRTLEFHVTIPVPHINSDASARAIHGWHQRRTTTILGRR
jgi:hypothetical protein